METTLHCHNCDTTKPETEFNRNAARKTGRDTQCRECRSLYQKSRTQQLRIDTDVDVPPERQCAIQGCNNRHKGLGYCNKHLKRYKYYGDPLAGPKFHERRSKLPKRAAGMTPEEAFRYFMPGDPPPAGELWLWTGGQDENGYGVIRHFGRNHFAHRIAYELFIGPIPDGLVIRHKNDTPLDVNPHNLEYGTLEDNVRDRVERGRSFTGPRPDNSTAARGERSARSKLTEPQIIQIRHLYAGGWSQDEIAKQFNVSQVNVSNVVRRKTWTHI